MRSLYLTDDFRVRLVTDPGDGCDLEGVTLAGEDDCPDELLGLYRELEAEAGDAARFGAACEAEAGRHYGVRYY